MAVMVELLGGPYDGHRYEVADDVRVLFVPKRVPPPIPIDAPSTARLTVPDVVEYVRLQPRADQEAVLFVEAAQRSRFFRGV